MGARVGIADLKRSLLEEVRTLVRPNRSTWKEPILQIINDLRRTNVQAVIFGGALRSLLVSRLFQGKFGRPRDVDVVVSGALSILEEQFRESIARRTRFGGLQLRQGNWHFDVWPVNATWAFTQDGAVHPTFAALPSTTTFNLEAIAVEAWPLNGRRRALFSGDDRFFEGILARTLELNRRDNPFPDLTVVRAVIMASELRFKIGPLIASYIHQFGPRLSAEELTRIQLSHYGLTRMNGETLKQLISYISNRSSEGVGVDLPHVGQMHLWDGGPPYPDDCPKVHIHALATH